MESIHLHITKQRHILPMGKNIVAILLNVPNTEGEYQGFSWSWEGNHVGTSFFSIIHVIHLISRQWELCCFRRASGSGHGCSLSIWNSIKFPCHMNWWFFLPRSWTNQDFLCYVNSAWIYDSAGRTLSCIKWGNRHNLRFNVFNVAGCRDVF